MATESRGYYAGTVGKMPAASGDTTLLECPTGPVSSTTSRARMKTNRVFPILFAATLAVTVPETFHTTDVSVAFDVMEHVPARFDHRKRRSRRLRRKPARRKAQSNEA